MRIGQTLGRGFVAAHGALLGALFLFLLQAPVQVLSAVAQGISPSPGGEPGQKPGAEQLALMTGVSCGTFVFGLAVFFLFPLVLGGTLGQVRDRLEYPGQTNVFQGFPNVLLAKEFASRHAFSCVFR